MRLRQLERRKRRTHAGGLFPNHKRLPPSAHDRLLRQEQLSPFLCIKNISCPRTVQYIRSAKKRFFKKNESHVKICFRRGIWKENIWNYQWKSRVQAAAAGGDGSAQAERLYLCGRRGQAVSLPWGLEVRPGERGGMGFMERSLGRVEKRVTELNLSPQWNPGEPAGEGRGRTGCFSWRMRESPRIKGRCSFKIHHIQLTQRKNLMCGLEELGK